MYAALQDLYNRFSQAEIDGLTGADVTVANQALSDATDTIDSYIGGRYTLPLNPVPTLLNKLCCDLARFNLYSDTVPEVVQGRHDNVIKLLTAISNGTATLGVDQADTPVPTALPKIVGGVRKFNDTTLDDFENPPGMPYS